ncbi:hypothetical protein DFH29DRAFT_100746 [Suillus ampliporus]|nr:hypothetical protein DFH29DRAFT_100746 [Suillus ampliporus]
MNNARVDAQFDGSRKRPQSVLVNNSGPQKIFPVRKASTVQATRGYFPSVPRKTYIYDSGGLHPLSLPLASTATANAYTLQLSSDHLLAQMDPSTSSHPSSSYAGDFPSKTALPVANNGFIPNPGMYMGQFPWPQPAYPQPGNATLSYSPAASSPGVGAADAYNPLQGAQTYYYPPAPANVAQATYVQSFINSYTLQPTVALPPQHASALLQYNRPPCPQATFAGVPPPYQVQGAYYPNMPPPMLQNGYLHQSHSAEPAMGSASSPPQTTEDREERKQRRNRTKRYDITQDADFRPTGETDHHGNPRFECRRAWCGIVIISDSYRKHLTSTKHRGSKSATFRCPDCSTTLSRGDALNRHRKGTACTGQSPELAMDAQPPYPVISQNSTSSASASPAAVPTVPVTVLAPAAMPTVSATFNAIENVQIPPQVVEVTQAQEMAVISEPLLPAPASSELPETEVDVVLTEEQIAACVGTLDSEALTNFMTYIDNYNVEDPKTWDFPH